MTSKRKGLAAFSLMQKFCLVMLASLGAAGYLAWYPLDVAENEWFQYQDTVAKRQSLLSEIKTQFGYGGAIHNFKNYVLRGTPKYADSFRNNYQDLQTALVSYVALDGVSPTERQALAAVERVVAEYNNNLANITPMVEAGKPASSIDSVVKVDDGPALEGFRQLSAAYAVLTEEVRNLAGRSATAAKEIKELIQDSVEKIQAGSYPVNESGGNLDDIVAGAKKVVDVISEIAATSHEQSNGIDQVNKVVVSLDEVTQNNAALAEETTAAAVSMMERASEMDRVMRYFTISTNRSA